MFTLIKMLTIAAFLIAITSCKDDKYDDISTVKFKTSQAIVSEDAGTVKIAFELDKERNVNTIFNFNWMGKDTTTSLGSEFDFSKEVSVKAFNKSSYIQFTVIDDKQIDLDDDITISIAEPSDPKVLRSENERKFTLIIKNNDQISDDQFQADLTWRRKNIYDNSNDVNLDLYIQKNVIIINDKITDAGTTVTSSMQPGGFETVYLNSSQADQQYYVVVYFQQTYIGEVVTYTLNCNGMGISNFKFGKVMTDSDVGAAYFIGPFIKSGKTILKGGRTDYNEFKILKANKQVSNTFHH